MLTSYILAPAIMTAPVCFLASRFGGTPLFATTVTGFTFASSLCGAAQSLDQIFRVIQGCFGGIGVAFTGRDV
jgi:MFS transporter, DHA2 family, multidrug resistance protein